MSELARNESENLKVMLYNDYKDAGYNSLHGFSKLSHRPNWADSPPPKGKKMKKQYLKSCYGATGSIIEYSNGTARLRIKQSGKLLHNKVHANKKAALAAWYRNNA